MTPSVVAFVKLIVEVMDRNIDRGIFKELEMVHVMMLVKSVSRVPMKGGFR